MSVVCGACSSLLELDAFERAPAPDSAPIVSCADDSACASAAVLGRGPWVCASAAGQCVPVLDANCDSITGPFEDPRALRLGALFETSGPQAETNRNRERSARLAIEELNSAGGVPSAGSSTRRPIALVACNAADDLIGAGKHLTDDLGVRAIIGPNGSQATIDLVMGLTVAANTLTISPTAVAASVGELRDADLSWTMVPSDAARAPFLLQQISQLEHLLRARRPTLKLSIILRRDVLGAGVRGALSGLSFNGLPLSHPSNLGQLVHVVDYDPKASEQRALLQNELAFAPDIIVLVGTAETVTDIMAPLEAAWSSAQRPHYVLTESSKVPDLLRLAGERPDLALRVRGIEVVPTEASQPVFDDFVRSYERRYRSSATDTSGMAASYDAAYALAYALAISPAASVTGPSIAAGLRQLAAGRTHIHSGLADLDATFAALASADGVDAIGCLTPFAWNDGGVIDRGQLEVWCVAPDASGYRRSGLRFDLEAGAAVGEDQLCVMGEDRQAQPTLPRDPAPSVPDMPIDAAQQPFANSPPPASDAGSADPAAPPENTLVDIGIAAQYLANNRDPFDNVISPFVRLINRSRAAVSLASLRVRYYFTNEHAMVCPAQCVIDGFYAGMQPSGEAVRAERKYVQGDASSYLELSFDTHAPALQPGDSVELQQQFHTDPYQDMDETDDYSFSPWAFQYADWPKLTVYQDRQRIWGAPPN